ncbi:hypothetical protein DPMN_107605 [Dreissena polymorpha]|uniref:Uncharacterized protein n=1 Tax=Dreissena polymorpha TaxID=45954 RepID=A0A9D4QKB9_DREPO|nr:hypothetical protein DPMN_107605 [Dreissena polymorpha]
MNRYNETLVITNNLKTRSGHLDDAISNVRGRDEVMDMISALRLGSSLGPYSPTIL